MRYVLPYAMTLLAVATTLSAHAADDVATLIRRQSQEFSDASASNDTATLAKYLDDRVIFINEGGDIATKKDIVTPGPAGPKNVSNHLVQTDFNIEIHGNVAVTSFTDNATVKVGEQTMMPRFRSTEVWLNEGDAWRMISSQTVALSDDPPSHALNAIEMDQYVGTYEAAPGLSVAITRQGNQLFSATNGAKPTPLLAEVRDVLFTPGQPRARRVFERDDHGKVTGFYSRREGHGVEFRRVG
ncbi:nuclear transport factor 2 family protein [Dyella jiangningensis]